MKFGESGGPIMFARIGIMQALNQNRPRYGGGAEAQAGEAHKNYQVTEFAVDRDTTEDTPISRR